MRYPAFIDCALSLMRRPASDLREIVSESVWLRLGMGMARCSDQLAVVLREGAATGDFEVEDPDYMANFLWTSTLGAMHLARIRVGLRQQDARPAGGVRGGARAGGPQLRGARQGGRESLTGCRACSGSG